jgi:hypothetical protein
LALTRKRPFEALLRRSGSRPYMVEGTQVHNLFDLYLINKRPDSRKFTIEVIGPDGAKTVVATRELELGSLQELHIPVHVYVPLGEFRAGLRSQLRIICEDVDGDLERLATAPILGPRSR